ncbi:MAG: hypothetical protein IM541_06205 [Chitinophagaceae bacterium]|nr:hypothetical protein [Chitinophagaceae bacterium]
MYTPQPALRQYLIDYSREIQLPLAYQDLLRFTYTTPIKDRHGKDSYWDTVSYDLHEWNDLRQALIRMYAILKTEGDMRFARHLDVARIDFCYFGNSQPFRIRIVNKYNDNYDHFYIKQADANRIYGLEMEHLLSPNRMTYLTHRTTLIEEHVPGIPGDVFIRDYLHHPGTNVIRLAKEFVKFNERCFVQLLGDMRSYNFVVNMIPDIEDVQYRIRAIDFDRQTYEGKKNSYLPQFFKENYELVQLALRHLNRESIAQYQAEEQTLITLRLASSRYRMKALLDIMAKDTLAPPEKIKQLREELSQHYATPIAEKKTQSMGLLLKWQMKQRLKNSFHWLPKSKSRFND